MSFDASILIPYWIGWPHPANDSLSPAVYVDATVWVVQANILDKAIIGSNKDHGLGTGRHARRALVVDVETKIADGAAARMQRYR